MEKQVKKENKIEWKQDGSGYCLITETRTSWIATTKHGSIRCNPNMKRCDNVNVWNKIIQEVA